MSALNNDYIWETLGTNGFVAGDDIVIGAGAPTTQAGATICLKSQLHRVTVNGTANAALLLRSIMSNDNPQMAFVVNDSAAAVVLFPFLAKGSGAIDTGETINGGASFSVAANSTAVLFSSLVQAKRKGGSGGTTPALNWVAAILN